MKSTKEHDKRDGKKPQRKTNGDDLRRALNWIVIDDIFAHVRLHGNVKWKPLACYPCRMAAASPRALPRMPHIGYLRTYKDGIAADNHLAGTHEAAGPERLPATRESSTVGRRRAGRKSLICPNQSPGSVTY